jgi:plasmid stabilization system protein ParE
MDFHLIYSKEAISDLEAILDEISVDDPGAASRFGISLYEHISLLKLFPRMGTTVPDRTQVRKLIHTPVVVYYVVNISRQSVEIIHLRHGARSDPQWL